MGDYYLLETEQIAIYSNVPPKGKAGAYNSVVGGKYEFYKANIRLNQFDIITDSKITVFGNGSSIGDWEKYIRIKDEKDKIITIIKTNMANSEIYFNLFDQDAGNIVIKNYFSRSANAPQDSPYKFHTGFLVEINNKEYGVLALHPRPQFYKKIIFNGNMNEKTEDKIILFILTAYEAFKRNDDVFAKTPI